MCRRVDSYPGVPPAKEERLRGVRKAGEGFIVANRHCSQPRAVQGNAAMRLSVCIGFTHVNGYRCFQDF